MGLFNSEDKKLSFLKPISKVLMPFGSCELLKLHNSEIIPNQISSALLLPYLRFVSSCQISSG